MNAILNGKMYQVEERSSGSELYFIDMSATELVDLYLETKGPVSELVLQYEESQEQKYTNLFCWGFQMMDNVPCLLLREMPADYAVLKDKADAYDILVGEVK